MKYCALILGGGNSNRFDNNTNKLLHKINSNKTVLEMSLNNFWNDNDCETIIVVFNINYQKEFKNLIDKIKTTKKIIMVPGGQFRHDSFVKGILKCLDFDYVMVHDAARPFLSFDLINRIKYEFDSNSKIDAIIPILSISDSVIQIKDNNLKYLNRDELKIVQTPQCFKIDSISNLINKNNYDFGDELSWLISLKKVKVKLIDGEKDNLKITFKSDVLN